MLNYFRKVLRPLIQVPTPTPITVNIARGIIQTCETDVLPMTKRRANPLITYSTYIISDVLRVGVFTAIY